MQATQIRKLHRSEIVRAVRDASEGGLRSKTTNVDTGGVSKGRADKEIRDEESSTSDEETDNTDVESADTNASNHPENEEPTLKMFDKMSDPVCSGLFRNNRELKQGM
ncbi:hypothetical protein K2173_025680 [Erythroxylum novogranatense]|uniref:Uncharacterized protein n=1 Tax=Erythroxylum novogranatense TaxID=1862640 RepID=A0AAV8SBD1_9ROSI|nr:hypothetical protein K2173_025680 [Erythroxylum novogranatense]